jgi:hypothetical protein
MKGTYALQGIMSDINICKIPSPRFSLVCEEDIEGKKYRATFSNDGGDISN